MESSHDQHSPPLGSRRCANCHSELAGEFCHRCGQSVLALRQSALTLVRDVLDGLFDWDGRLLRTLRGLLLRPGRVARDYIDGRRASYTPPMRLYVVISVVFFAMMSMASMRVIALETTLSEDGEISTLMTMWQSGAPKPLPPLTDAQREEAIERLPSAGAMTRVRTLAQAALEDPLMLEQAANASASQAQILMVVIFALLCLLLHPRRRLIEHIVHALYFHACLLPVAGLMLVFTARVSMSTPWLIAWAIVAFISISAIVSAYDRGFYGGRWWTAVLRSQLIIPAYIAADAMVAIGLLMLSLPPAPAG